MLLLFLKGSCSNCVYILALPLLLKLFAPSISLGWTKEDDSFSFMVMGDILDLSQVVETFIFYQITGVKLVMVKDQNKALMLEYDCGVNALV